MIRAADLRLNNLVLYKGNIVRVYAITEPYCYISGFSYDEFPVDYEDIEPIPITEEWCKNLGMSNGTDWLINSLPDYFSVPCVDTGYLNFHPKYGLSWEREIGDISFDICFRTEVKYVHQLQNLYYALTNQELTIQPSPK